MPSFLSYFKNLTIRPSALQSSAVPTELIPAAEPGNKVVTLSKDTKGQKIDRVWLLLGVLGRKMREAPSCHPSGSVHPHLDSGNSSVFK